MDHRKGFNEMLPTVDVCIIMRNEEDMLPRCLDSVVGFADNIICVDTGSEDRTIEIAKSYGAKVYEHPWENDFSLHRNQSLGYSSADWVCILDCDECIVGKINPKLFKKRLKMVHPAVSALVVTVSEISDKRKTTSWLGMRFFRKSSGIYYKGAVHNKAVFGGGSAGTDINIIHYGYSLDPEKMNAKYRRTEGLLMKRIEKDPNDFIAMYYLVQIYVGEKKYDKAEEYGLLFFNSVTIMPDDFQYLGVMYFYMGWIYLHKKDGEKAYAWTKKGLEYYPDDLDLNYMMARIGYQAKMDDLLKEHAEKYLEILPGIRKRGKIESDSFINAVNNDEWFNRTVFSADIAAELSIKKFLEAV